VAKSAPCPEYSIASVSKLTGISCHALRVWERRYGYPIPHRAASGHRRYAAEQVRVLKRIAELVLAGSSIGALMANLQGGRLELAELDEKVAAENSDSSAALLLDCLVRGDLSAAEREFQVLEGRLSREELLVRILEPALVDAGERWFRNDCEIFQEHGASSFLRRKLGGMLDAAQRSNTHPAHSVVIGTVQGDRHEGGVLMLSVLLESAGWRAQFLGVDLPVREYQKAVERWKPDAVAVSFVLSRNINKRFKELAQIRGLPVFVGGRSILNYQGLARRNGLIPLAGPASVGVAQLIAKAPHWHPGGVES
jgi:methanogenic corrinoid protein MtbC1